MPPQPRLSVLLPTLNSMALLPGHIESMLPWLDLASEIIIVDSHSVDGTAEYIQNKLAGYHLKFHSHDRGLYQSWNYGIQQATCPWLYISTVGDSIERPQLQHLIQLGEETRSDVILSCPRCVSDPGCDFPVLEWAIHEILQHAAPHQDFTISSTSAHFYAWWHSRTSAVLGSTASNLYRTDHFKKYLFPLDYGTAGDGAWGLLHAHHTRFAVTAKQGSIFRLHVKSYTKEEYHVDDLHNRLFELGRTVNSALPVAAEGTQHNLRTAEAIALRDLFLSLYETLKARRKSCPIWYFLPSIWKLRCRCKQTKHQLDQLLHDTRGQIRSSHFAPIENQTSHGGLRTFVTSAPPAASTTARR